LYRGWEQPWTFVTDGGQEVDLWSIVKQVLGALTGRFVTSRESLGGYSLEVDLLSDSQLWYYPKKGLVFLVGIKAFGISNVRSHLEEILIMLSGRLVQIRIEYGTGFWILASETEAVFEVYLARDSNFCEVLDEDAAAVCRVGQGENACVFCTFGSDGRFRCEKPNTRFALELLRRLAEGTVVARRIGNCAFRGLRPRVAS